MNAILNVLKLKSKTVNFNALFLALVGVSKALGYEIPAETVAAVQTILNIILRFVTTTSLESK